MIQLLKLANSKNIFKIIQKYCISSCKSKYKIDNRR